MEPVIELENFNVALGGRPILKDMNVKVGGRAIGLLGPNGAGKTTLIHSLLGFHPITSGTAKIFGQSFANGSTHVRSDIGYMPERDSFISKMSCVRFTRFMAELSGLPAEAALERSHEALFYVGLGEARYRNLDSFSLGMKQLAKLAQAIVHGPKLMFLDEPTNGLDPAARHRMIRLIREIRDSGKAHLVISSHLLRDIEECCDEILILKGGKIAVYCNLEEERKTNLRFLMIETRGDAEAFSHEAAKLGCECATSADQRLRLILPEGVNVKDLYVIANRLNVQIRRLSYRRDSLEDIFLKAMEGGSNGGI
jgi:ABC-2 type transport system ATP-binding protein